MQYRLIIICCAWIVVFPHNICAQELDTTLVKPPLQVPTSVKNKRWTGKDWIFPSTLITIGSLMAMNKHEGEFFLNNYEVREERNKNFTNFSTHADNYIQYSPIAGVFLLSACGVKGKNNLANQTALFIKSELLMTAIVFPLKYIVAEPRPDSGAKNSFPSGHTALVFMAATFFSKEYGPRSVWYSVGAYTTATAVGALRVLNNRHWLSDVLVGAGIGILSTNIIYATHQHRWGKKKSNKLALAPMYNNRATGIYIGLKF